MPPAPPSSRGCSSKSLDTRRRKAGVRQFASGNPPASATRCPESARTALQSSNRCRPLQSLPRVGNTPAPHSRDRQNKERPESRAQPAPLDGGLDVILVEIVPNARNPVAEVTGEVGKHDPKCSRPEAEPPCGGNGAQPGAERKSARRLPDASFEKSRVLPAVEGNSQADGKNRWPPRPSRHEAKCRKPRSAARPARLRPARPRRPREDRDAKQQRDHLRAAGSVHRLPRDDD